MLFGKKVIYFGYVVLVEGVVMDLVKIVVVKYWIVYMNVIEVCFFFGLCSYYRRFIKDFLSIVECLYILIEKGVGFKWIFDC